MQYEYLKQIGQGTFGAVFLARHNTSHEKVAIKHVKVARNNHRGLTLLLREIQILK
jgi:serine/threonine protein kinase